MTIEALTTGAGCVSVSRPSYCASPPPRHRNARREPVPAVMIAAAVDVPAAMSACATGARPRRRHSALSEDGDASSPVVGGSHFATCHSNAPTNPEDVATATVSPSSVHVSAVASASSAMRSTRIHASPTFASPLAWLGAYRWTAPCAPTARRPLRSSPGAHAHTILPEPDAVVSPSSAPGRSTTGASESAPDALTSETTTTSPDG